MTITVSLLGPLESVRLGANIIGPVESGVSPLPSPRQMWWKCPEGPDHEWRAHVRSRSLLGYGCPYCAGRITSASVSIAATHPEIAAEWHPTKNGNWLASSTSYGSHREVWWVCPTGLKTHEYLCRVNARKMMRVGCAKCARLKGQGGAPKKRGPVSKLRRGRRPNGGAV